MYVNRSTDISSFSNCLLCKTAYIVLNEKNHLDKILVLIENVKYTAIQYVLYIFFYFSSYNIILWYNNEMICTTYEKIKWNVWNQLGHFLLSLNIYYLKSMCTQKWA